MIYKRFCKNCKEVFYTKSARRGFCGEKCRKESKKSMALERAKELREISKEIGNCTNCHKPKESMKYSLCSKCREYCREYYYKKKGKKK